MPVTLLFKLLVSAFKCTVQYKNFSLYYSLFSLSLAKQERYWC